MPVAGSTSSLLTTMAILLANYDAERDYLSNFEPFVLDRLKSWPVGEEARPKQLCQALSEAYHLPSIPINTVTELRDRVRRAGYLVADPIGRLYPNPDALAKVPNLISDRSEFLDHFDALAEAIVSYAWEVHNRAWTKAEAEAALERFVEEFSIELAMAKRAGDVDGSPTLSRNEALAVVHGFARRALEQREASLDYLEEVVRASMLANVIYLQDLGKWKPNLDHLVVYLDTTIAFRVLELTDEEVSEAARQLIDLLHEFSVPVQIFDHTLVEMQRVLEGVQTSLRTINTKGKTNLEQLARQGQEVLAHAIRQGWGPADVEEVIAELKSRLGGQKIAIAATPKPDPKLALDERRLDEILRQLGFPRESQRVKDIQSLVAIHALRGGRSYTELGQARAIFVTSNDRLVKASNFWFDEQGRRSIVPQCTGEVSFTTQLWLRKPEERPNVARKFLIAESFAALNPEPELWERYLDRIAQRRNRREITDEQVKALVFSTEAKERLVELTHGEPERIDDEAIGEVLASYEERIPAKVAEQLESARRDIDALQAENETLRGELTSRDRHAEDQDAALATQNRELDAHQKDLQALKLANDRRAKRERAAAARRRRMRGALGLVGALVFGAAALAIWLTGAVDSDLARAGAGFAGACLAVLSITLGFGKGWHWAVAAIVFVGAFPALFFGLLEVADHEASRRPPTESVAR
jgi:hypothetical protein